MAVIERASGIKVESATYGPWLGSMRSVTPDQVPPEYIASIDGTTPSNNFIYLPRNGAWKLRGGSSEKFDTFGAEVGLLPDDWEDAPHADSVISRVRHFEELVSDAISGGVPTLCALVTREAVPSSVLDDGRFSNFWLRDQVGNYNYTLGSEFNTSDMYPAIGTTQLYRYVPLWYDSGDGGITRGVTEFLRRFFVCGSRRFLKVGGWWHFPSVLGTPSRWDGMFTTAGTTAVASHLIPAGPFPPTHAGTVSATAAVTTEYTRPDADSVDGSWINSNANQTNLFSYIDEATADDTDYISSNTSNTACTIALATPSTVPTSSDTVTVRYRNRNIVDSGHNNATIEFLMGSTTITSWTAQYNSTTDWKTDAITLTSAEILSAAGVDATWATAFLRFTTSSESGSDRWHISQAYLERIPAAANSDGGWKGKDRFFIGVAYRFEDDSIWMPTQPRFPNPLLSNGLDLVTVDSANPEVSYTSITRTNLPIPPKGVKSLVLLRTDKIDSSVDDNLQLNPTGFKVVDEVPAGTTSYVDYKGDDTALVLDVEQYFIRYDHIMAPRARYIFGGDMRVCHGYGGSSPCAIVLAPVGRAADYDLNLADTAAALYTSNASYMQFAIAAAGTGELKLVQSDGATATDTETITLSSTLTLQGLVDTINATSFSVDGQQWRAQLAPGAFPDAIALTSLTPHNRAIASCVVDNAAKTITKAAGGLSKVAVGQLVSGAAEEAGAYVTIITSDTSLTYTGTLTTGTETLYFYNNLGDPHITDPDTTALGFQRVIANSLPAFLYFNKTYLDTLTFDKQTTWMTVASPGSVKAAANCFSGKTANRFSPPSSDAGICMGGGSVDHGFVVPHANKVMAILPRGPDSITDQDYGAVMIDEVRGCCAWNTITQGPGFVAFISGEGVFAADLHNVRLISEAIYVDQPTARGDFTYEGPQSVAAAAADTDGSYAWARILRGVLWVGYRTSASTAHPDRRVRLDFASGDEATGMRALYRKPGVMWGWSTPLTGEYALMCEGRRSDGIHLYGWENQEGSTGDGRIDEVETGTTDNGTAITGRVELPWLRPPDGGLISGQEIILEHSSPTGSTGSLYFHRSFSDDAYALTPGTSALGVYSEMKLLPFNSARTAANACFVDYRQATGSARELRKVVVKFKLIPRYKT